MRNDVYIIHGSYGSSKANWFPWMKQELEKINCRVIVPDFPTPENQNINSWLEVFFKYQGELNNNSILIGHSIGAAFVLNILERINLPIKASFLVAGFVGLLDKAKFDEVNKTISDKQFDWNKIKQNCKNFYLYHSDNDPYVPLTKAQELAINLETEIKLIKGAGHINKDSGFNEFKLLLDDISSLIKN